MMRRSASDPRLLGLCVHETGRVRLNFRDSYFRLTKRRWFTPALKRAVGEVRCRSTNFQEEW
eukprot:scaffold489_cov309-Pavlova_lutheri.AAC.16